MRRLAFGTDRDKLAWMRRRAGAAARNPAIVALVTRLTRAARADDYLARCEQIHRFVRDGITYVRDPGRKEQLAHPVVALQRGAGDCDDKVLLCVALARAIGIDADVWPIWASPEYMKHVQWACRWPGSRRHPRARQSAELDGPAGDDWIVGDPTIRGAELGDEPLRDIASAPDTGLLPLA